MRSRSSNSARRCSASRDRTTWSGQRCLLGEAGGQPRVDGVVLVHAIGRPSQGQGADHLGSGAQRDDDRGPDPWPAGDVVHRHGPRVRHHVLGGDGFPGPDHLAGQRPLQGEPAEVLHRHGRAGDGTQGDCSGEPTTSHDTSAAATSRARSATTSRAESTASSPRQDARDLRRRSQPVLPTMRLLVEAGVLDRDAGGCRQGDHDVLVLLGEVALPRLLRQVEVAEHLVADPDRDAEERAHRRVVRAGTRRTRDGWRSRAAAAARAGRSAGRGSRGPWAAPRSPRPGPDPCRGGRTCAGPWRGPEFSTPSAAYWAPVSSRAISTIRARTPSRVRSAAIDTTASSSSRNRACSSRAPLTRAKTSRRRSSKSAPADRAAVVVRHRIALLRRCHAPRQQGPGCMRPHQRTAGDRVPGIPRTSPVDRLSPAGA